MKSFYTPDIKPSEYVERVSREFIQAGDPLRAEKQRAYMRHQFEYCGLTAPQWMARAKTIFANQGMYTGKPLQQFVECCLAQEYREVQYVGLEMMQRMLSVQDKNWIHVLEKCIVTHSWWDSVDWLAKLVGIHFKRFPDLQHSFADKWIRQENMWLKRAAIIHQLFYREQTDEELLFALITHEAENTEFFIRKACGWALRQHAKTYPAHVRKYIQQQSLSGLTVREAMKQLNREK